MEKVLANDFLRKTDNQVAQILGLQSVDNITQLKKALGVNSTDEFTKGKRKK